MSIPFRLLKRKDMRKDAPADSKLLYVVTHTNKLVDTDMLCDYITSISTASKGDVKLILEGFFKVLETRLLEGDSINLQPLGTFRMVAGSPGFATEEEFSLSLIRKPKIVYRPGVLLNKLRRDAKFERNEVKVVTVEEVCDKEHVI